MKQYDDPVEVRRSDAEGPDQFLWRGRLWKVRAVLAHWVETSPWGQPTDQALVPERSMPDHGAEVELWRVQAGRGLDESSCGVFDLSFDGADERWQLVGCLD